MVIFDEKYHFKIMIKSFWLYDINDI